MRLFSITTESGSKYHILEDSQGEYFLRVENVENPNSVLLVPDVVWKIEEPQPWPAVLGAPILLSARKDIPLDSARRIPGGGKWTSRVVDVKEVS